MPEVWSKLYYRYACTGQNILYLGFSTIYSFTYPLEILKCITDKEALLYDSILYHLRKHMEMQVYGDIFK
jgi:hypothetical protein